MNPFVSNIKIRILYKENILKVQMNGQENISSSGGHFTGYFGEVELDEFVKSYKFSKRKVLARLLKPVGLRILFYVESELKRDYDYIELHRSIVAKELDMSESSVGLGIADLIENGLLIKKGKIEYWINPEVMFFGDRKEYFKKYAPQNIIRIKEKSSGIKKYNLKEDI
jgi:hypothetical protein